MGTDKSESRESQGYAWASQAGAVFSNPFASELARDCETPSLILLRKWPCAFASLRDFLEQTGLSLASKRGCVVKKHPQVGLRVSFPQQVQHSLHESTLCFLVFPSVYIRAIRGLKNDPLAARMIPRP